MAGSDEDRGNLVKRTGDGQAQVSLGYDLVLNPLKILAGLAPISSASRKNKPNSSAIKILIHLRSLRNSRGVARRDQGEALGPFLGPRGALEQAVCHMRRRRCWSKPP
jgi:hypothetical protein